MNEMTSYIKTEKVDLETVMLDQNLPSNLILRTMSESNRQNENIYTNANDLPLLETEHISNSINSEFECKHDPLQINFQDSNTWFKQNGKIVVKLVKFNKKFNPAIMLAKDCLNHNLSVGLNRSLSCIATEQGQRIKPWPNDQVQSKNSIRNPLGNFSSVKKKGNKGSMKQVHNTQSNLPKGKNKYHQTNDHGICGRKSENPRPRIENKQKHQSVKPRKPVKYECRPKYSYKSISKKCPYCHYTGKRSCRTHEHMMIVHDQIKPFICKICEYSTAISQNFKKHQCKQRYEYAKIEKQCPHCNVVSKHSSETHWHIREVHDKILETCPYCDFKGSYSNKNRHIITIHDQIKRKNENPIIKSCSFCSFKGLSFNEYRHIMNIHDRIRPFKCKLCEFYAADLFNLKRHKVNKHKI